MTFSGEDPRLEPLKGWSGYNNPGIAAVAIACVLNHSETLSLAKALLIMPVVMHSETTKFLASDRTRSREIASLVAVRPDFVQNFNRRFYGSLAHSINAIQILHKRGDVSFDTVISRRRRFHCTEEFGKRSQLIDKASAEIANLLRASEEELYLNLRVQL